MANKPFYSKEPYHVLNNGGSSGGGSIMRFISGEGAPGPDEGAPGDVYLNTVNGDLYTNKNGTWTLELNLKGPKGDPGERGPAGIDGADGAQGPKGDPGEDGSNGSDGADGFPTEAEWNALVARVAALETPGE